MSNVQVTEINGMKIYNLTGGKSLYELMKESHFSVKKLKKNEEYMNHIEILQDCSFPVSSECLRLSNDGNYLFASGIYPPRLKIFDLNEMSLKCERGFDSQIRKIEIISDDYKKCAVLSDDRSIELHAQYGKHFKIRIPKYGRDLKYDNIYCDLFACGTGNEIYRLNLHQGQFLSSLNTKATGINAININTPLELLGCACENGIVDLFDLRSKEIVYEFDDLKNDISAISFSDDGMQMAIGNNIGNVQVFDIRNPKPLYTISHAYRSPIKKIVYDEHSQNIITVDKKIAKFSNMKTGRAFTNIEPKHDINDFVLYKNSGMFFFANESEKVDIYFVPQLGPAPKWASFLDNITEELEEAKTYSLYEDYKFLTAKELDAIGGASLIGTKMVKAYMHGYFIDWKLYKRLREATEPFSYDKYLQDKKQAKMEKLFGERIVFNKGIKPKVNAKLLNANIKEGDDKKKLDLTDSRFAGLFNNKDFEIDFNSEKFKKKNKTIELNNQEEEKEDTKEKEEEDKDDAIVNKEIMRLNQKLLNKKRQKVNKMYSGYDDEEHDVDFDKRIKSNKDKEDEDDEEEFEIESKIRKLEGMKAHKKEKDERMKKEKDLTKGKRLVGGLNKLSKVNIR